MFTLAVKAGRLSQAPVFPSRLARNAPRQGFFEHWLAMTAVIEEAAQAELIHLAIRESLDRHRRSQRPLTA